MKMYKPFSPNLQFLNKEDQNQVDPHSWFSSTSFSTEPALNFNRKKCSWMYLIKI